MEFTEDDDVENQLTERPAVVEEVDDEEDEEYFDADTVVLSWRRLFHLPFQPIWYYSMLVIATFQIYLAIYQAGIKVYGKRDSLLNTDFKAFAYPADLMYAIDILLIIGCKNLHGLELSPLAVRRPNWVLFADAISLVPAELFVPMDPLTPFRAKLYYILHLSKTCKVLRIFNTFYYGRNRVGSSNIHLHMFEYCFSIGLAVMIGFVLTYQIICFEYGCSEMIPLENYLLYLYISVSRITARGFAVYPTNVYWLYGISLLGLIVFTAVICTSISYVTIALYTMLYHKYGFLNKLQWIDHELKILDVPEDIAQHCTEFFNMFWQKRMGYDDDSTYFEVLPQAMYEEITLDISWYAMKHSRLLRNMDVPFLRHVSVFFKSKYCLAGEIIYNREECKTMLIYVVSGVVQILSQEDDETPILSLSAGTCLGESSLIFHYKPKGTVRCKTFCRLHVLETRDFFKLIKLFPGHFVKTRRVFRLRLERAQKFYELTKMVNSHFGVKERTDYVTIMWLKNTLHKLMAMEGDSASRHQLQNVFSREDFAEERFVNRHFSARELDMLVISEKLQLVTDTVFLKNSCPCIFKPDSIILQAWEVIIVFLAVIIAYLAPFYAFVEPATPIWYEVLVYIITIFWVLDLYIQMSTAVKTPDGIKATVKTILLFRLSTKLFLLDVGSSLPLEVLSSIFVQKATSQYRALLYLNRAIKIWRIHMVFNSWENKINSNLIVLQYFKSCCIFCYAAFLCSCIIHAMNCFDFVCVFDYKNESTLRKLLWYLDVTISILTGVCIRNRLLTRSMYYSGYLFVNLISTIFYVFFYGSLAAEYALKRSNKIRLSEILTDLFTIINAYELRNKYNRRIVSYVETQWHDNKAATLLDIAFYKGIFRDLPPHMYEALREQTHKEVLCSCPLFQDLPESIILEICTSVRDMVFPPNEVITYTGDIRDIMCIIAKGYCRIDSELPKEKQQILGPKDSIAVLESYLRVPVINTVVTITHCKMATIDFKSLSAIYTKYPMHMEELEKALEDSYVKTKLERMFQTSSINNRFLKLTDDVEAKSFCKFAHKLKVDSLEEYDYYIPFDRLGLLSFVQYFLLRRTILPESTFFFIWEITRSTFAILSALFFPINNIGTCTDCVWFYVLLLLDGMAWIDIYLRFHVCYYNEERLLVTHPLKTAIYYLQHGFLLDLCGVLPVQSIVGRKHFKNVHSLLQLNRVLQMHRYIGFLNYIETTAMLPVNMLSLFKYFPIILVVCTCTGSVIINFICEFGEDIQTSSNYTKGIKCTERSWIDKSSFAKPLSPGRVQTYSVYFTTSIFSMAGMMGFKIYTAFDAIVVMILSVVAYILSAHIISKTISQYTVADSTLLAYQSSMRSVLNFMTINKVKDELQQTLLAHYELKWQRKQGRDIKESISRFNRSLQQDILYDVYGRILNEGSVFISDSKNFLRNLLFEVQHDVNKKDSFITTVNDVTKHLHILFKGKVNVIASDGTRLATLTPGSMFGNLDNYDMVRLMVSVVAMGHVEILSIEGLRFHQILSNYPSLHKRYRYLTSIHVDYLEGRGRVAREDELTCATNSSIVARLSSSKNPLGIVQHHVFKPGSTFIRIWHFLILAGVCFIEVCFDLYQMAMLEYALGLVIIQYICDILYIINYYVVLHTAIENDVGLAIKDLTLIKQKFRQNRINFWFYIVSMVPFDVFTWFAPPAVFRILHPVLRLNRLLRFGHVIFHFQQQKQKLDLNLYVWRFTFIMLWSSFVLHFCTCLLIILCCLSTPNMNIEIECSTTSSSYEKVVNYIKYHYVIISCFLRASQHFIFPQSMLLTIYCIFLMIFLLLVNAIFLAQIYNTLQMGYQRQNIYTQKLERIRNYMQREHLSESLYVKAFEYLRFLWTQNKGTIFPRLLEGAPIHIQEPILNSAFGHHINNHFVFAECHIDFNRQLVACLRNKTYFKDDYIVLKGTINKSIYFIHTGRVRVLIDEDSLNEKVLETLKPGMSFGVSQGLFPDRAYSYSFRAVNTAVILCLYLDMWKHLLRFFPATKTTLYKRHSRYTDRYA